MQPRGRDAGRSFQRVRDEVVAGIEMKSGYQIGGLFKDVPVYKVERANSRSDKQRCLDEFKERDDAKQPARAGVGRGHGNRVIHMILTYVGTLFI